jgi:nitrile hydratase accessory protein
VSDRADPAVADPAAPAAPPRANGELVFEEPWESRAFGLAVALHDSGVVDFEEFRSRLVEEIAAWERDHDPPAEGYRYYERWLTALERTLAEAALIDPARVAAERVAVAHEWAHDHGHPHT